MSIVTHKYTPAEMSDQELEATFAAREHTVDYLVKSLRDQIRSNTLSSFVVTGPRGAGKSTVIHMVDLRMRQDAELRTAWISILFPEEQFNISSLRDLLAAILEALAKAGIPASQSWLDKVAAEPNDEQSQQLAVTGLREITRKQKQRLVVFVENLNLLLEDCLDDQMKGTLRRLLMTEPFMLLIGSAVHVFDSLKQYDEAFFNYFGPVPLDRLTAEQVFALLRRRAEFDGNESFLRNLPSQQPKIRAIVHLAGGNPRLILMLYELLSQRQVTTIVQYLRRLVDELTPLLKDEMENLSVQQRKIIHALMEKGGTATPTDLVEPTRLTLNAINAQLKRLKDAQFVEVQGGGKGRAANYTVPDKLFAIWYQMRYLSQNRRRIELFVEVLRVWFEVEERFATLNSLAKTNTGTSVHILRETATAAEYFAASLLTTSYQAAARDLAVQQWLKSNDRREAAFAHAELDGLAYKDGASYETKAYVGLGRWYGDHANLKTALDILDPIIESNRENPSLLAEALVNRGVAKGTSGDVAGALADFSAVVALTDAPKEEVAAALVNRGVVKGLMGDIYGAIAEYTSVVTMKGAPSVSVAYALVNRGVAKEQYSDVQGGIADYTTVITMEGASPESVAQALINRGLTRMQVDDVQSAMDDYTTVITKKGSPLEEVARALVNRGFAKGQIGDAQGEMADYTAVITMEGAPLEQLAQALVNRGLTRMQIDDVQCAVADFTTVIKMEGATNEHVSWALANLGAAQLFLGDKQKAIESWKTVVKNASKFDEFVQFAPVELYRLCWKEHTEENTNYVLERLVQCMAAIPHEQAAKQGIEFLGRLASSEMREGWVHACRYLLQRQSDEVKGALGMLDAVCNILEGGEKNLLDPLPPEQRDFANSILSRFEAKPVTNE